MIKAEIISHEGTPAPNWLDRCRAVLTPTTITIVIAVLAIGGITLGLVLKNHTSTSTAATSSQPAQTVARPLTVQEPNANTIQPISGNDTIQSANGGSGSAQQPVSSGSLGQTSSTPDVTSQTGADQQTNLRDRSLLNTVQSTVQDVHSTLKKLKSLHKTLDN